jgi:hypothetical protein
MSGKVSSFSFFLFSIFLNEQVNPFERSTIDLLIELFSISTRFRSLLPINTCYRNLKCSFLIFDQFHNKDYSDILNFLLFCFNSFVEFLILERVINMLVFLSL